MVSIRTCTCAGIYPHMGKYVKYPTMILGKDHAYTHGEYRVQLNRKYLAHIYGKYIVPKYGKYHA